MGSKDTTLLENDSPACPALQEVLARAESRLRCNSYLALKNVTCEAREGALVLRGCLPSYYLKQMAQTAVAQVQGARRIVNEIEVVVPSQIAYSPG
jgi:osmotically-inducible protein OsmY